MKSFYNHDELMKTIPKKVLEHLKIILKNSTLEDNEDSFRKIIESWLTKKALFEKITEHGNFTQEKKFSKDNKNGCIAMTISGSIIAVSPIMKKSRKIVYTSIKNRTDVPANLEIDKAFLSEDIIENKKLKFSEGPLEQTSEIIGICTADKYEDTKKQFEKILKTNQTILKSFIKVNKDTFEKKKEKDELSSRNDLFLKWIIIQWFIIGGFEKHVFMARVKILWLELFTKLYEKLNKTQKSKEEKEKIFLEFTNENFAHYIDDYKWYESEKKDFDIGLMKALEEIPEFDNYWEYLDIFTDGFK